MPKGLKVALAVILPLLVIGGAGYGLAKIGLLPVQKLAGKNKALAVAFHAAGLTKPSRAVPAAAVSTTPSLSQTELAAEKKSLTAERAAFEQEKADWQTQIDARRKADAQAQQTAQNAAPDPKELARMAAVYEEMPTETVARIFAKLPDEQIIGLLRRMDEKKVADFLSVTPPDRAARLTLNLSRAAPPPPDRIAANP